ncbi:MAG TPA: hypothetical protein VFJ13_05380 [Paracoccaceae bacterium]|nr:hypothetical protein [Paracoccaceae bacterium]
MRGRADQPLRHRKARDRAAILTLVGAILFLPPVAGVFRVDATVAGVPLLVVCIFGVWAALIAGAAALAPRLRAAEGTEDPGSGADGASNLTADPTDA